MKRGVLVTVCAAPGSLLAQKGIRNMWKVLGCLAIGLVLAGCEGGDPGRIVLRVQLAGLPDLGVRGGTYEGWLRVDGTLFSTGKFRIDATTTPPRVMSEDRRRDFGPIDDVAFGPSNTRLGEGFPFVQGATEWFVTIEPETDDDGEPSDLVILGGFFNGAAADLDASGLTSMGGPGIGDLSTATGSVLLANPTGGGTAANGVWFVSDAMLGTPSLGLPPAPGSWRYAAWITDGTQTLPLGTFTDPAAPDSDAGTFAGAGPAGIGYEAPGQDFVNAFTTPGTEPLDLASGQWTVSITLEPEPDDSPDPFPLVLLSQLIPTTAIEDMVDVSAGEIGMVAADDLPSLAVASSGTGWFLTGAGLPDLVGGGTAEYALWSRTGMAETELARFVVDPALDAITSPDGTTVFGTTQLFVIDPVNSGLGAGFPAPLAAEELFITVEGTRATTAGGGTPSVSALLAGEVVSGQGVLTPNGSANRGVGDFLLRPAGRFFLRTPTDDSLGGIANDRSGIYFRRFFFTLTGSGLQAPSGLELPRLRGGWRYEGWVSEQGTGRRFSTGRFADPNTADEDAATFPGAEAGELPPGFAVPGQDFLLTTSGVNVPGPLTLGAGWTVFVTLEPNPDTSAEPSPFEILRGPLPTATGVAGPALTNQFANLPSGRAFYED